MLFAPVGVFGAVAAATRTQGIGVLATYGKFIGTFYVEPLWCCGRSLIVCRLRCFWVYACSRCSLAVREPLLIAFTTASSEAAYPKLNGAARPLRRQ